jgi:hypothetical protein
MKRPEVTPKEVVEAIKNHHTFKSDADNLIEKLEWCSLNGCYCIVKGGIFYGIEIDGYIHT